MGHRFRQVHCSTKGEQSVIGDQSKRRFCPASICGSSIPKWLLMRCASVLPTPGRLLYQIPPIDMLLINEYRTCDCRNQGPGVISGTADGDLLTKMTESEHDGADQRK